MDKTLFYQQYGNQFQLKLNEAQEYVEQPESLKSEVEQECQSRDPLLLRDPEPDQFAYRLTHYRGFVRFPERLKNFIVATNEPRGLVRSSLPTIIDLEPNSRCNFRCIMCQVSEWENGKRTDDLSIDDFHEFVDRNLHLTEVKLHGMGEPLMHKGYCEMVQYLVEQDIWVRTSINGSLLHVRDNHRRLIDAGIGEIQTSFDGATKDVFEHIRQKSDFERVVNNLTMLNNYANKKDRLYTRMWVVLQKHNRHQLFEFVELAKRMGFRRLSYSLTLNDWGQKDWRDKNDNLNSGGLSAEEQRRLAQIALESGIEITLWYQKGKYSTDHIDNLCRWIFDRPYVSCDLRIVPCCMIADPSVTELGGARDLKAAWNGAEYRAFRQAHMDGDIPLVCQGCYVSDERGPRADVQQPVIPLESL